MISKRFGRLVGIGSSVLLTGALATPARAATITVDTTSQAIDGNDGQCSLPEAIFAANFDVDLAIDASNPDHFVVTECIPGNGDDTIVFDLPAGSVLQMDHAIPDSHNYTGPTATPMVFTNIVIEAGGVRFEHVGGANFRAFAVGAATVDLSPGGYPHGVSGTGNLTIRDAHVKGFKAKGGNGADGGGGGLGAGGAIFVAGGALTVESCTFEGNSAIGGDGSVNFSQVAGGGGGGLAGDGGVAGGGAGAYDGGGGGGGSWGDGGRGGADDTGCQLSSGCEAGGGGGGGTVFGGTNAPTGIGRGDGGFSCGAPGGTSGSLLGGDDGADASCPGGGGGGGASRRRSFPFSGNGGHGAFGGGGGGGGYSDSDGGDAGFGGGGGSGTTFESNLDGFGPVGGNGGFGGGGGAAHGGYIDGDPGSGGAFAGDATPTIGGGGAALGGAIFATDATVQIHNSTFTGNYVAHGYTADGGHWGIDAGGAIFSHNGSLSVRNSTIAGNSSTGDRAGVMVYAEGTPTGFELRNTIVAGNGERECSFDSSNSTFFPVVYGGSGNLIVNDYGCTGLASQADPMLGPLQLNKPGSTPTMAIDSGSPAFDAGDDPYCTDFDQRGLSRPRFSHCDIGAFEVGCTTITCPANVVQSNDPGRCGAVVTYPDPTTDGSCTPVCIMASNAFFPVGASSVTCTADAGSCSFSVTVNDTERPNVTAPPSIIVGNDPGLCSATVDPGVATTTDNCPGVSVSGVRGDGLALNAPYPVGATSIVWTATDAYSNTSVPPASQTVKVNNVEPPSLSDPTASPAALWPPNHKMREETISYVETDNCPGGSCTLSVASTEPVNGPGDGNTTPDWIVESDHQEQLRAERSGLGDGRTYTTTVVCADLSGNTTNKSTAVRVGHEIDAPASGSMFAAGARIPVSGHFFDGSGATHAANWSFDGIGASGTVVEPQGSAPGAVTGSTVISSPGVYSLSMKITDANGQTATTSIVGGLDSAVVVYPSTGLYIAGGGWISSPPGAYPADPNFAGKASFGFVSKSARSAKATGGETEFDLHLEGFKFNAINFQSQVVDGAKAQLRGAGAVNGAGGYGFLLTVIDAEAGGGGADRIRLKIWNKSTGAVVYDNQMGAPDDADPVTSVDFSGAIVIQK